MRRFDKDKNMAKANILAEQRYLKSKEVLDEGLADKVRDIMSKAMPKVKDSSDAAIEKSKELIANAQGFAVKEWNNPENKAKIKSLYAKLKEILSKIKSAGWEVLSNPKKLKALLVSLKLGTYAALIKGIWDLIFATTIDIGFFTTTTTFGGIFFFKLALFLFGLKIVLGIIGGSISLSKILGSMVDFIKDLFSIFTSKNGGEEIKAINENISLEESITLLFNTYGYENKVITN